MISTNSSLPMGYGGSPDNFVFLTAGLSSSNASAYVIFSASSAFPLAASSVEIAEDIAEGIKALKEPTVATWKDVRTQLGL